MSYPVHEIIREKLDTDIHGFFEKDEFFDLGVDQREEYTRDFLELFPSRPLEHNVGGCDIKPCYWLYLTARWLRPELIVESGVWKGLTLWLWRAACADAEIHAFDIDLNNLVYRDASVSLHEADWADSSILNPDPEKGLIFFDDHVNQARRMREAFEKGFRWLLFDDNVGPREFWKIGNPPVPTIQMLLDPKLEYGVNIIWEVNGTRHSYVYSEADCYHAKELIDTYRIFPTSAALTLVKLKG